MSVEKFSVAMSAWLSSRAIISAPARRLRASLRIGACAGAIAASALTVSTPVMAQEIVVLQSTASASPVEAPPPSTKAAPSQTVVAEFVTTMLSRHPALRAADAEFDAVEARARGAARSLYNPTLEAEYEDAEDITKSIGISQTLDLAGKRRARARAGRADVDAARATRDIVRKALLTELLTSLADFQTTLELKRLSDRRLQNGEEFFSLADRRNSAGDLSESELLTARLSLAKARADNNAAKGALSLARQNLSGVTGEEREIWPLLVGVPKAAPLSIEDVQKGALPELVFARAQSDASSKRIKVAKRNRKPDPTVGVSYGREGAAGLVGVRASIPIPVLNSFKAEVDAARADATAAQETYTDIFRRMQAQLTESRRRYAAASEAWRQWSASGSQPLSNQRVLLEKLWRAGELGAVDYLIQLDQTYEVESAAIELRGRLWNAWFDWLNTTNEVNEWVESIR
jgi:outer membrane protein, heavy metal efflux system